MSEKEAMDTRVVGGMGSRMPKEQWIEGSAAFESAQQGSAQ